MRSDALLDIAVATTDAEIEACFPVMSQLRPQVRAEEFISRVRLQMKQGYRLAGGRAGHRVVAVAGFRFLDHLAFGRTLYVDDLVTDSAERSRGYGEQLMQWLIDTARAEACRELHLDSGVQRFDAHRFYLSQRMRISSHHFALDLGAKTDT